jgi:hypothetical protein
MESRPKMMIMIIRIIAHKYKRGLSGERMSKRWREERRGH